MSTQRLLRRNFARSPPVNCARQRDFTRKDSLMPSLAMIKFEKKAAMPRRRFRSLPQPWKNRARARKVPCDSTKPTRKHFELAPELVNRFGMFFGALCPI